MPHTTPLLRLIGAFFAAMLLLAACGDDDAATSTTTDADGGDSDEDGESGTGDDGDIGDNGDIGDFGEFGAFGVSGECRDALNAYTAAYSQFGTASAALFGGGGDADFSESQEQLQSLAENAPSEIKADLQVFAEQLGGYFEALAGLSFSEENPPGPDDFAELEALGESIDSDALEAAADNISAWFEENCDS